MGSKSAFLNVYIVGQLEKTNLGVFDLQNTLQFLLQRPQTRHFLALSVPN